MKIDKESEIESMGEMLLPRWRRGGKKEKKIEKNNWKFAINLPNSLLTGLDQCDLFVNWLLLKPVVMNRRRVTTAPAKINLLMFKTHFIFPHWRRFNIMVNRATDGIIFFFSRQNSELYTTLSMQLLGNSVNKLKITLCDESLLVVGYFTVCNNKPNFPADINCIKHTHKRCDENNIRDEQPMHCCTY